MTPETLFVLDKEFSRIKLVTVIGSLEDQLSYLSKLESSVA